MKVTLTKVIRKQREGRKGPYTSLLIKTREHGDNLISGFGNQSNADWREGDSVDLEISEVEKDGKKWLNFEVPRPSSQLDRIEQGIKDLNERLDRMAAFLADKQI